MGKHAYCIVANANFAVLETCFRLIDDTRNDIYVIFDAKAHVTSAVRNRLKNAVRFSTIRFEKDIIVNWAGYSQVQAELNLLVAVSNSGVLYEYIHFLQGSDIPIKTQDDIHNFFSANAGYQFVSIEKNRYRMAENKSWYRHYFCHNRYFRKNKIVKALNFGLVYLQKILRLRVNTDIKLYQGSALFSITGDCAKYLCAMSEEIHNRFRYALAADEVFIQTILMNSAYRNSIMGIENETSSNARLIDRSRPDGKNSPHIWRSYELSFILSQPAEICFARKFDEEVDLEIVKDLYRAIKEK